MDGLDLFIIATGIILLFTGLYLFISGKQGEGTRNSNVEGFGVKINVSNPSIILIVMGIALILVPKFLPNQTSDDKLMKNPPEKLITINTPVDIDDSSVAGFMEDDDEPSSVSDDDTAIKEAGPESVSVYFPSGQWYLTSYSENNIDLSGNVTANMNVMPVNNNRQDWQIDMAFRDYWGNISSYRYGGYTIFRNGQYLFHITQGSDGSFFSEGESPLVMNLEANGQLHMEYDFNGSHIITHWFQ